MPKAKTSKTPATATATKGRKPRKSQAGPTPAPGAFLRNPEETNPKKARFHIGRDATLASVCKRIVEGKAREGDVEIATHKPLVDHPKVATSAYLAPLVEAAQAAIAKGA